MKREHEVHTNRFFISTAIHVSVTFHIGFLKDNDDGHLKIENRD